MDGLPSRDPAAAAVRLAVRRALAAYALEGAAADRSAQPDPAEERPLLLVALSGGADSLALAVSVAYEAPRAGFRAGAVVVDHGLQTSSAEVAGRAAAQASAMGLEPVLVSRVSVEATGDGPEGDARTARYRALDEAVERSGAALVLTAHTRDDQAEQVLLGIARGSGSRSLAGIPARRGRILRPLLGISRSQTESTCRAEGLTPWRDPHNDDDSYTRVRVRKRVLPMLEEELGPGVAAALLRTAEQAREDSDAFDDMVDEQIEEIVQPAEAGIAVSAAALLANPAALRHRIIRRVVAAEFGGELSREQTLAVAALVTHWRGQGPLFVPGARVTRERGLIVFRRQVGSPRAG